MTPVIHFPRALALILAAALLLCAASCGSGEEKKTYLPVLAESGVPCVCIDPGHGFDDPGAESDKLNGQSERDVTLAVALLLADELRARGVTVILTHDGETFPVTAEDDGDGVFRPQERVAFAQTQPIDLFVSLHCDSFPSDESVHGTRIYYASDVAAGSASALAAGGVGTAVDAVFPAAKKCLLKPMTGDGAYYVLRKSAVPSILIEMGFITNPEDAASLISPSWQADFARGTADGIAGLFDLPENP